MPLSFPGLSRTPDTFEIVEPTDWGEGPLMWPRWAEMGGLIAEAASGVSVPNPVLRPFSRPKATRAEFPAAPGQERYAPLCQRT